MKVLEKDSTDKQNVARVFNGWNKWKKNLNDKDWEDMAKLIINAKMTLEEYNAKFRSINDPDKHPRMLGEAFQLVDNFLKNGFETKDELNRAYLYLTLCSNHDNSCHADLDKIREELRIGGLKHKYQVETDDNYKIRIHEGNKDA